MGPQPAGRGPFRRETPHPRACNGPTVVVTAETTTDIYDIYVSMLIRYTHTQARSVPARHVQCHTQEGPGKLLRILCRELRLGGYGQKRTVYANCAGTPGGGYMAVTSNMSTPFQPQPFQVPRTCLLSALAERPRLLPPSHPATGNAPPRLRLGIDSDARPRAHAPPRLRLGIYGDARPLAHTPPRLRLGIYGAARPPAHASARLRIGICADGNLKEPTITFRLHVTERKDAAGTR